MMDCQKELLNLYKFVCDVPSDINEHCPLLQELSSHCKVVVEFGMRSGVSTTALLFGQPEKLITYDLNHHPIAETLKRIQFRTNFEFRQGDSRGAAIPECDLLFIDTLHTEAQLTAELERHSKQVRRWIAMHDTETYGGVGEGAGRGLLFALVQFLANHKEWTIAIHKRNNNGFTLLTR